MGGDVALSADLGMRELLLCNKLDHFSLELGSEGATGEFFSWLCLTS